MFEKVWSAHTVREQSDDTPAVLYIDLHLVHEVTSPQAFSMLRERGLAVRRPDQTIGTMDHSTPTTPRNELGIIPVADAMAAKQLGRLQQELRRLRHSDVRARWRASRHRTRDRTGERTDAAGHDNRLRRQPYEHAWRIWRAGIWHRHQRSRPRAGDADAAAEQAEDHGGQC